MNRGTRPFLALSLSLFPFFFSPLFNTNLSLKREYHSFGEFSFITEFIPFISPCFFFLPFPRFSAFVPLFQKGGTKRYPISTRRYLFWGYQALLKIPEIRQARPKQCDHVSFLTMKIRGRLFVRDVCFLPVVNSKILSLSPPSCLRVQSTIKRARLGWKWKINRRGWKENRGAMLNSFRVCCEDYVALTTQHRREKLKEKRSIRVEGKFLAFFSSLLPNGISRNRTVAV